MLSIVSTPLGNPDDLSLRALKILTEADVIICESTKETSKLLRHHGISGKTYEILNEHTRSGDFTDLVKLCQERNCALVSDCGTPGFCDPGSDLVNALRKRNVQIKIIPGPSAIAALLSICGVKNAEFLFVGFVPAETESREKRWRQLVSEQTLRAIPMIFMDTPYRLTKTLDDLSRHFPKRRCILMIDVTMESELIYEDLPGPLLEKFRDQKAEFMIWVGPKDEKPKLKQ